ncbi:MAG: hypothetical protein ACKOTZ_10745 [Chloroflexota bacterium]
MRSVARILDRNVKLWHLLLTGVALAAIAGGSVGIAAAPAAFFASGTTRLASAAATDSISVGSNENKRVLRVTFTVPSDRTADAQATFSGTLLRNIGANAYCFGEFALNTAPSDTQPSDSTFKPGVYQLAGWASGSSPSGMVGSMTGFRRNIGPGTHNLDVIIRGSFSGCQVTDRALNVIVQYR